MESTQFLGLPLSVGAHESHILSSIRQAWSDRSSLIVTFINPHAWTLAQREATYLNHLIKMDLVLPDGIAVAKVASVLSNQNIQRLSFDASSLYHPIFTLLNSEQRSLFIIGGVPGVAQAASNKMKEKYPLIHIADVCDGFQTLEQIVRKVLDASPEFVLCGMGAPHQERLLIALREAGYRGCAFTCGGFLDQLIQSEQYYPMWIDRLELRWLWRIWKEPKRLWRRYAIEYLPFARQSLLSILGFRNAFRNL